MSLLVKNKFKNPPNPLHKFLGGTESIQVSSSFRWNKNRDPSALPPVQGHGGTKIHYSSAVSTSWWSESVHTYPPLIEGKNHQNANFLIKDKNHWWLDTTCIFTSPSRRMKAEQGVVQIIVSFSSTNRPWNRSTFLQWIAFQKSKRKKITNGNYLTNHRMSWVILAPAFHD